MERHHDRAHVATYILMCACIVLWSSGLMRYDWHRLCDCCRSPYRTVVGGRYTRHARGLCRKFWPFRVPCISHARKSTWRWLYKDHVDVTGSGMAMAPSTPATFDSTLGSVMIAGMFAFVLYGILSLQCWIFLQRVRGDRAVAKYSVCFIWCVNTIALALLGRGQYWYMVTNYAHPEVFNQRPPWFLPTGSLIFTTMNDMVVQCWFVHRIWIFSGRNHALVCYLIFMALSTYAICIGAGAQFLYLPNFAAWRTMSWNVYLGTAFNVLTDLSIAMLLTVYYRQLRSLAVPGRRSYHLVNTLMVYTINTGLATSILCLGCGIARAVNPNAWIFTSLLFPIGGLYANALLASLNARDLLGGDLRNDSHPLGNVSVETGRLPACPSLPLRGNILTGSDELATTDSTTTDKV